MELKWKYLDELYREKYFDKDVPAVYLKSEADKVIADLEESHKKEVGQLLIEIAELKSEIERLEILCANYRHDCDNLAISNEQVKRAARTLLKKMNHNKYKRCLAMASGCEYLCAHYQFREVYKKRDFFRKWMFRWLAIAEKFKPNYNEYAYKLKFKELADTCRFYEDELRHHKYHRCLDMAARCMSEEKRLDAIAPLFDNDKECWEYSSDYWNKWHKRWLEIATKFKEAK